MISQMQLMKFTSGADVKHTYMSTNVDLLRSICDVIIANRLEFFMFFSAVLGYFLLFCARLSRRPAHFKEEPGDAQTQSPQPEKAPAETLKIASSEDDHAPLLQVVRSMRSSNHGAQSIVDAVLTSIQDHPQECDMTIVNDIFDYLGGQLDSELMELILGTLPGVGLQRNQRTYEIFLKMHVATRDHLKITGLVAEAHAEKVRFNARALFSILKGSLQAGDFVMALKYFKDLKAPWECSATAEPLLPQSVMMLLVELAWKEQQLGQLVLELQGMPLTEKTIDAILAKCVESQDSDMATSVEALARAQRALLPDSTYSLLIQAMAQSSLRALGIVEEVMSRESSGFSPDLAVSVIEFCKRVSEVTIVDRLFERMKPKQVNVLGAFVWFYIGAEQFEKACDVYELDLRPLCCHADGGAAFDPSLQESIIDAAVVCGRSHLAEQWMTKSSSDMAGRIVILSKVTLCIKQLIERACQAFERWNAVVFYWVVLVL